MSKTAFTLAETLITLTIIGVIAALTIPTMVSKYQKHTYIVGLKKVYSELNQAFTLINNGDNCLTESRNEYDDYACLSSQLKNSEVITYDLKKGSVGECISKSLMMADGTIVCYISSGVSVIDLAVDVNGKKGPNKYGRDRFLFQVNDNTSNDGRRSTANLPPILAMGSKAFADFVGIYHNIDYSGAYWKANPSSPKCNTNNSESEMAYYCAGRVLEEDAMNY